jgi:hypothetical protein
MSNIVLTSLHVEGNVYYKEFKGYLYFYVKRYNLEIDTNNLALLEQLLKSLTKLLESKIQKLEYKSSLNLDLGELNKEFSPELYILICRINITKLEIDNYKPIYSNRLESLLNNKFYSIDHRINILEVGLKKLKSRKLSFPIKKVRAKYIINNSFLYLHYPDRGMVYSNIDTNFFLDNSYIEPIDSASQGSQLLKLEFVCRFKVLKDIGNKLYKEKEVVIFYPYYNEDKGLVKAKDLCLSTNSQYIDLFRRYKEDYNYETSSFLSTDYLSSYDYRKEEELLTKEDKLVLIAKSTEKSKECIPLEYINQFEIINPEEDRENYIYRIKDREEFFNHYRYPNINYYQNRNLYGK